MGGAYKVEKLAARDSHFLLNNFLIKNFDVFFTRNFCIREEDRGGRVGGAYKVKKLAARDSHFLPNNFLITNFGVSYSYSTTANNRPRGG